MDLQARVLPNLPDSVVIRDDLAEQIGIVFMRRVIREVRNSRHGGIIVFAPSFVMGNLLKTGGPLRAKYRIEKNLDGFSLCSHSRGGHTAFGPIRRRQRKIVGRLARVSEMVRRISVYPQPAVLWSWPYGFRTSPRSTVACCWITNSAYLDLALKFKSLILKMKRYIEPLISKHNIASWNL